MVQAISVVMPPAYGFEAADKMSTLVTDQRYRAKYKIPFLLLRTY